MCECVLFQLQLWNTRTGQQIVCFYHAVKPVFTLDCRYLLYIDSGQTVITYCLKRMAPVHYVACPADDLLVLPVKHCHVVVTKWTADLPDVSVWDFCEGRLLDRLTDVSAGGIQDVSRDGVLAVDSDLQVFNLDSCTLMRRVGHDTDLAFVRLTYDGEYVVWVDMLSVRVGRVSDGSLIAHTCTHERLTSLCMLDCGYTLVVGREDGRILMMRLLPDSQQCQVICRPHSAEERTTVLRSYETCSNTAKASFDLMYQCSSQSVRDSELPRASDSIRGVLAQRAKVPLLSTAKFKSVDAVGDKFRRSYSTAAPISDSTSYHDIASSSECVDSLSPGADSRRSADDSDMMLSSSGECGMLSDRLSSSVSDVMALCTLDRRHATPPHHDTNSTPRTPAHRLFRLFQRGRRKKHRQTAGVRTDSRDRMPSV